MSIIPQRRSTSVAATFVIFAAALLQTRHTLAGDLLGLYIGGAAGQSQVEANVPTAGDFKENHSAFKGIAGKHPIPLLPAPTSYIYFCPPTRNIINPPPHTSP